MAPKAAPEATPKSISKTAVPKTLRINSSRYRSSASTTPATSRSDSAVTVAIGYSEILDMTLDYLIAECDQHKDEPSISRLLRFSVQAMKDLFLQVKVTVENRPNIARLSELMMLARRLTTEHCIRKQSPHHVHYRGSCFDDLTMALTAYRDAIDLHRGGDPSFSLLNSTGAQFDFDGNLTAHPSENFKKLDDPLRKAFVACLDLERVFNPSLFEQEGVAAWSLKNGVLAAPKGQISTDIQGAYIFDAREALIFSSNGNIMHKNYFEGNDNEVLCICADMRVQEDLLCNLEGRFGAMDHRGTTVVAKRAFSNIKNPQPQAGFAEYSQSTTSSSSQPRISKHGVEEQYHKYPGQKTHQN